MTWPCFEQNGRHVLRETSALPSFTRCEDVSLCLGTIIGSNSVDFLVECFIMTPFGCRVMHTSRAVMCVSTETGKNVTNHRGQSQINNLASNGHVSHVCHTSTTARMRTTTHDSNYITIETRRIHHIKLQLHGHAC